MSANGFPDFNDLSSFTEVQQAQLRQFAAYLYGYLATEHKDTGGHSAVTADSVAVGTPAAGAGNVTGTLVPTTATQTLGRQVTPVLGKTTGDVQRWQAAYLDAIYFGVSGAPVSGFAIPAWQWLASGTGLAMTPQIATGQTFSITSLLGVVLARFGGSTVIGTSFATDGTTIANLSTTNCYASGGFIERARSTRLGEWTSVAYNSANFTTSSAATWTVDVGDQLSLAYTLIGKTMLLDFQLSQTSVSAATPAELRIAIPGGFTAASRKSSIILAIDNGTQLMGEALAASGNTYISLFANPTSGAAWSASANNTGAFGQIALEVQ